MVTGKIVVIGATGTLGPYLVDELLRLKYDILAVGRSEAKLERFKKRGVDCAVVDVTSQSDFDVLPRSGVAAVIQLAGSMPASLATTDPYQYIDVNVTGTLNTLEYCRKAGVRQHVSMNTRRDTAIYWNTGKFISSDAPRSLEYTGDHAVYGISKWAAVDLVEHYHQRYGLQTVVLRLCTVYNGAPNADFYQNGVKRRMAYRLMIEQAMRGETLEIWGDPQRSKDMPGVDDFTQLVIKVIESDKAQGMYNCGTGVATTLEEQVRGIAQVFSPPGKPSKIVYRPDKPSQTSYLFDISKAVNDLGFRPRYSYIQMLERMKVEIESRASDSASGAGLAGSPEPDIESHEDTKDTKRTV